MMSFFSKTFTALFLIVCSTTLFAASVDYSHLFQEKSGCFILYDFNKNTLIAKYNPVRCKERIPSDSTFKVALSLMAFDQGLINQQTVFKWDGKDKGLFKVWNQDQTPKSWIKDSVVWVSQELTHQLGIDKIKEYLHKFHYGNQDFSGDPGKNNALMRAWISSSLKISADEEFNFMKALVNNKLPVSQQAMRDTKENMYIETSPHGWKLYGKSGSGDQEKYNPKAKPGLQDGWFVGFVEKGNQMYVFILNFSDLEVPKTSEFGGLRAKAIVKNILREKGFF